MKGILGELKINSCVFYGIILVTLALGGCLEDENAHSKKTKQISLQETMTLPSISEKLHLLPPSSHVSDPASEDKDAEEWQEVLTTAQPEVTFSSPEEVFLPFEVQRLKEQRQIALEKRKNLSYLPSSRLARSFPIDPDYKTHSPSIGEDKSTFPVTSDRVLTADRYIPIVLENSINSQLGGRFIGVVDEHVFSNQGRKILLPKGSRLICSYESLSGEGHSRLSASCHRVLRPDGVSLLMTDAYVADSMGRKGIPGNLDHRLWDKYGAAFVLAGLSSLAAAGTRTGLPESLQQSTAVFGFQTAQMTAQTLKETINIAPVLTVASGSRLLIIPMNDIWLRSVTDSA